MSEKIRIFLVGKIKSSLPKHATKNDVLSVFYYYHSTNKMPIRKSAEATSKLMIELNPEIDIDLKNNTRSIVTLFEQWKKLKKNEKLPSKRRTNNVIKREKNFKTSLAGIFKISKKTKKIDQSDEVNDVPSSQEYISSSQSSACTNDTVFATPRPLKKRKLNPEALLSALDRCKITDRRAALILDAMERDKGQETNARSISGTRSYVRRRRMSYRKKIEVNLKFVPLTVHWDGKAVKTNRHTKVELLPIVVTSGSDEQFLHCALLDHGTGAAISKAVFECLQENEINIISMCYDTTSVNTGCLSGACKFLELELGRDLLNASCRHHIAELLLGSAFDVCFPEISTSPEIIMFNDFRDVEWAKINKKKYQTAKKDRTKSLKALMNSNKRDEILLFINETLNNTKQPREDYKELLELSRAFLSDNYDINFLQPGATHRARWMSKTLYTLKMYMFRAQLDLSRTQKTNLCRMSTFIVFFYVPYWFKTRLSLEAALTDLAFLKDMYDFQSIDPTLSAAILEKFVNHLWYLSKELISISLFNDKVSLSEKKAIVHKLKTPDEGERELRAKIDIKDIPSLSLSSFATQKSMNFFKITGISSTFLELDPSLWVEDENYTNGQEVCKKLQVVNDSAERAVAMCNKYTNTITKDPFQWQKLLHSVYKEIKEKPINSRQQS